MISTVPFATSRPTPSTLTTATATLTSRGASVSRKPPPSSSSPNLQQGITGSSSGISNGNGNFTSTSASSSSKKNLSKEVLMNFCVPTQLFVPSAGRLTNSILLEKFGSVIQELQLSSACRSSCHSHALTYANKHVKRLIRILDFVLSFGLKRKSDSYWPLAREFSSKGQIEFLLESWKPKTNRARALSWLYQCLNDGLLEFQMQNFSKNINGVRKFYAKSAYLFEIETLETVAIFLRGLENVTFRLFSLDQALSMDFTNGDNAELITECCAEHERVLLATSASQSRIANGSSMSNILPMPSTFVDHPSSVSSSNFDRPIPTAMVKVSPSKKIRQRGVSISGSSMVNDQSSFLDSLETSVADFSECPDVLGLTEELRDRMLSETDFGSEAIDYNYPTSMGGFFARKTSIMKRKPKSGAAALSSSPSAGATTTVRKIIDQSTDQQRCTMIDDSDESYGGSTRIEKRLLTQSISATMTIPAPRSFSNIDTDPDTMFTEIISRPRSIMMSNNGFDASGSLPMSSTPIGGVQHGGSYRESRKMGGGGEGAALENSFRQTSPMDSSGQQAESGPAVLKYGDLIIDSYGLPSIADPSSPTLVTSSSSHHLLRSSASASQLKSIEPPSIVDDGSTDFERQIRRRLQTVSDVMAMYSDSISEHSGEHSASGKTGSNKSTTRMKLKKEEAGVVEEPSVVVMTMEKAKNGGDSSTVVVRKKKQSAVVEYGEMSMESGDIVDLTVHIFTHDGEQFLKMYRIYTNHHFGTSSLRYLLLTNYAIYILTPIIIRTMDSTKNGGKDGGESIIGGDLLRRTVGASGKTKDSDSSGGSKYKTEVVVPYNVIDYISVGANGQLFNIFTLQKRQPVAMVCTCDELLTGSILSRLESTLHRFSSTWTEDSKYSSSVQSLASDRLPIGGGGVVTDATPQIIGLKKWLCGELGKDDVEIARYNLIYWNPNALKLDMRQDSTTSTTSSTATTTTAAATTSAEENISSGPSRSGYLYVREYFPTGWIWKSSEWKQSYFMLRGKKLYQFEDSTCKVGQRVFDLKNELNNCRQIQTNEYAYCMEISFNADENTKIHLGCQTKHELQQWLYSFVAGFSQADVDDVSCECVSCCAVLTASGHLILGQESSNLGFVRTLASVRMDEIAKCRYCAVHSSVLLEFTAKIEYAHQRWLLSFPCESEMSKFLTAMKEQEIEFSIDQLSMSCEKDSLVCSESSRHWLEISSTKSE